MLLLKEHTVQTLLMDYSPLMQVSRTTLFGNHLIVPMALYLLIATLPKQICFQLMRCLLVYFVRRGSDFLLYFAFIFIFSCNTWLLSGVVLSVSSCNSLYNIVVAMMIERECFELNTQFKGAMRSSESYVSSTSYESSVSKSSGSDTTAKVGWEANNSINETLF